MECEDEVSGATSAQSSATSARTAPTSEHDRFVQGVHPPPPTTRRRGSRDLPRRAIPDGCRCAGRPSCRLIDGVCMRGAELPGRSPSPPTSLQRSPHLFWLHSRPDPQRETNLCARSHLLLGIFRSLPCESLASFRLHDVTRAAAFRRDVTRDSHHAQRPKPRAACVNATCLRGYHGGRPLVSGIGR